MVKLAPLLVVLATATADAGGLTIIEPDPDRTYDEPERPDDDPRSHNKLGFRGSFGALPLGDRLVRTIGFGLGVEHRASRNWSVFGEYEWLAVSDVTDQVRHPERVTADQPGGHGHRTHVGVRRALVSSRLIGGFIQFYVDGELGGGLGIASLPEQVSVRPHAFGGVRFGYDLVKGSQLFELEILLRVVAIRDGAGLMGGLGFAWGD